MPARRYAGPGIAKVRHPRPHGSRVATLTRVDDAVWALLFAKADVVSEGAVDQEDARLVYRGTTSIILLAGVIDPRFDERTTSELARIASVDPHFRLRALRIAHREAFVRATGALQSAQMELEVRRCDRGIRVDVDVDAEVDAVARQAEDTW